MTADTSIDISSVETQSDVTRSTTAALCARTVRCNVQLLDVLLAQRRRLQPGRANNAMTFAVDRDFRAVTLVSYDVTDLDQVKAAQRDQGYPLDATTRLSIQSTSLEATVVVTVPAQSDSQDTSTELSDVQSALNTVASLHSDLGASLGFTSPVSLSTFPLVQYASPPPPSLPRPLQPLPDLAPEEGSSSLTDDDGSLIGRDKALTIVIATTCGVVCLILASLCFFARCHGWKRENENLRLPSSAKRAVLMTSSSAAVGALSDPWDVGSRSPHIDRERCFYAERLSRARITKAQQDFQGTNQPSEVKGPKGADPIEISRNWLREEVGLRADYDEGTGMQAMRGKGVGSIERTPASSLPAAKDPDESDDEWSLSSSASDIHI